MKWWKRPIEEPRTMASNKAMWEYLDALALAEPGTVVSVPAGANEHQLLAVSDFLPQRREYLKMLSYRLQADGIY